MAIVCLMEDSYYNFVMLYHLYRVYILSLYRQRKSNVAYLSLQTSMSVPAPPASMVELVETRSMAMFVVVDQDIRVPAVRLVWCYFYHLQFINTLYH